MWERDAVIEAVVGLLGGAKAGAGGSLFVLGEAGLGKTTALDHVRRLAAGGFRVGHARGHAMEASLPFGLLAQALDAAGGPDLLGLAPAELPRGDMRAMRYYAAVRWVEGLGKPVLLALDDLHWADPDSIALLCFLCRRIAGLPVAVVATLRPWPPAAHQACVELTHDGDARLERLAPLSQRAAAELLRAKVGWPLAEEVVGRACALCAGNPLLLEQVALAIARGEDLPEPGREGPPPVGDELVLARFAGLPAPAMRFAQAASVLGHRFLPEPAAEVAGLDEGEVDAALEALMRSGLLRQGTGGALEFVHPLFCQALYDDLVAPLRARLHARALGALARRGMDAEAAEHAARSNRSGDPQAIGVLETAGRAALQAGAPAAAIQRLTAAAQLAGEHAHPALLLALAGARLLGGHVVEAVAAYERVLSDSGLPAGMRVEALRMLGRGLFLGGEQARAAARFQEAADLAVGERAGLAAQVLLDHATTSWLTGGPAVSLPLAARARELAGGADATLRRQAEAAWAFLAVQAGEVAGVEAAEAAARLVEADPDAHLDDVCWTWGSLWVFGSIAFNLERLADAERVFRIGLRVAERVGAGEAVASLCVSNAYVLWRLGRLAEALAHIDRAAVLGELAPMNSSYVGVAHAHILLQLGRVDDSEAWCRRVEGPALARGELLALLYLWDARGRRCLRDGRLAEACALYERAEELYTRLGFGEPCQVPWARQAIASYLGSGRYEDASRVIGWVERCAEGLPCRYPRIAAAVGRAGLAERGGDHAAAEGHFRRALALHEQVTLPLERLETLLDYGAFLRHSGHPAQARPVLAEGLELGEGIGAGWLAGHLRAELAVAGGRRRRTPEHRRHLTPQEERVAQLAASGYGDREIARQLSVSVSTIETHLQHIYAKLGIHSRRQLMRMAASEHPDLQPPTSG